MVNDKSIMNMKLPDQQMLKINNNTYKRLEELSEMNEEERNMTCNKCIHLLQVYRSVDHNSWFECELIDDARSQEVELTDSCKKFKEREAYQGVSNKVLIDKEKLIEDLRCIVGACDICDMPIHSCKKKPCGYGLSDKKIEEIIHACMDTKETIGDLIMTEN